jgi:predicted MPP superfamily phosphohydrolase
MRVVHLSDIHLSKENLTSLKQFYISALLKDLKKWNSIKPIDLIVITGDLIDKGGISFSPDDNCYEIFEKEFISPILNELSIDKSRFIFVPGNHDVVESKIDKFSEKGFQDLSDIKEINTFVTDNRNNYHIGIERIKSFKEFEKKFYEDIPNCYITNFESCFIVNIDGQNIGIAGFNSAWRCSPKLPYDKLLFGTQQILDANTFFQEKSTSFNIALIHHPIEFISEIDRNELKSFLYTTNFHVKLCGHTHKSEPIHEIGTRNKLFTSVAKTAFSNPREKSDNYKSGYTILDFEKNSYNEIEIICHFRKYIHDRISFDKDVDTIEDGEYRDKLNLNSTDNGFNKYLMLTNKTYKAKHELMNNCLVIHGTDSIAPRDINEIFVLPKLAEKPILLNDIEEEINTIKLTDILNSDKNILIIGDKETGKSTLLNKIFIESSNSFTNYQIIPIEIDFSELKKKDIKALAKSFLNEPEHLEVDALLEEGKMLILIDNYIENEEYIHAVNRLKRFIADYSKNKIIITTSIDLDTLLTSENTIFAKKPIEEIDREFKPVFIGSVGVKEFKELAIKWFKRKDGEWIQNNLEKLIKVFEILRIPRTFFSISLFLWIIEKQENFKPINKANLVQQFLTFILEGLKMDNAKAGSYNFDKKIELLTELALFMYKHGDNTCSYSISETKAINCIQLNFDLNQLNRLSASEKIVDFIDKGILKKDLQNNCIRFRYDAFFKFFLSLNIEKNKEFREEVYSDEKFLSFIDELDYQTGRKRDDFDTLKFVMQKLQESYIDIDKFINKNVDKYFPNESFILKHINPTNFVSETRKNKLSDDEIEEALGNQLEMLPVNDSIKAKNEIDYKKKFYHVLELASRVLKNSENIKNPSYINESLDIIVNKAAKYGIYLQSIIAHNLANNKVEELPLPPEFFITIAPIINQLMLLSWIGTDFLETPLELKIKNYLKQDKNDLSQYELYLTGFIYSDMKMREYVKYIDKVIDKVDNVFILELCFLKVFLYYMFRPVTSSLLPAFEKQMAELLVKSRGINKKKAKKYVEEVLRKRKDEAMSQLKIDF